jgi:2,4-dienoyl-CoA reductase-like NADH-dependent reductase (Old Yellow Enzyme family)
VQCSTLGPTGLLARHLLVSGQNVAMAHLFDPLSLRALTLSNRIVVSPMCQYSSVDGFANDWHFVHLGTRAAGGAALVMTEASAVTADGRISPQDLGIYQDAHVEGLARCVRFIHSQKTLAGTQLAHAGRKASTARPWDGGGTVAPEQGGWEPIGPAAEPFAANYPTPRPLTPAGIVAIVDAFRDAARRALEAGFDVVELHAAHGYLMHEFFSPLVNTRTDEYGGSFDNRIRLCLDVVDAVRRVWPERLPLFVRISATDWKAGGWDLDQAVELARRLRTHGVDLVDCSSGGAVHDQQIAVGPGYQVPFAERIRRDAGVATGAVGLITRADQADAIIANGQADIVLLARELLRDPYWPLHAAEQLGHRVPWPPQYLRAAHRDTPAR